MAFSPDRVVMSESGEILKAALNEKYLLAASQRNWELVPGIPLSKVMEMFSVSLLALEVSIVKELAVMPVKLLIEELRVVTVKESPQISFQRLVVEPKLYDEPTDGIRSDEIWPVKVRLLAVVAPR